MANLSSVLKSEINRLARKEIKAAMDPLRKANSGYRRDIAELKRQVAQLQRQLKATAKAVKPTQRASEVEPGRTRFVAKGVKSLRSRLGLSAADFGLLVGASGQSVYNWEAGKTVPRAGQQAALAAVRGLGKREALKRIEKLA